MPDKDRIVLFTGGARSGKSRLALEAADSWPARRIFIATAEARDEEMRRRIEAHRRDRGPGWSLLEEPLDIATPLTGHPDALILVDCLTLWVSNMLIAGIDPEPRFRTLLDALKRRTAGRILLVTNEVGMGVVPNNELARRFRDEAGRLNQRVAAVADAVILAVSGIALRIKG